MKTIFWPANHFKVNVNDIVIRMDSTEQIRYCDITNNFITSMEKTGNTSIATGIQTPDKPLPHSTVEHTVGNVDLKLLFEKASPVLLRSNLAE